MHRNLQIRIGEIKKMHASHRWVRASLLGGVALGVMSMGAQAADDLSGLKAQLEALQARVNQLEAKPAPAPTAQLPQGASFLTIRRGSNMPGFNDDMLSPPSQAVPTERGFTIAITPAADVPAPIMEVTVSGYVKADFQYDFHNDMGDFASTGNVRIGGGDVPHFRIHARESRFRVKSRSDTAVGQIRTLIEVDFYGDTAGQLDTSGIFNELISNSAPMRLRHAWGEWDVAPNTTLGFGQFWSLWFPIGTSVPKLDFTSAAGSHFMRQGQFRITNRNGPWTFAISFDNPESDLRTSGGGLITACGPGPGSCGGRDVAPDVLAAIIYRAGGHWFALRGMGRILGYDDDAPGAPVGGSDSAFGWGVQGNVKLALSSMFAIYINAIYGDGIGRYLLDNVGGSGTVTGSGIRTHTSWGANIGATVKLSPTISVGAVYGYWENDNTPETTTINQEFQSFHGNIFWQPVKKFRLGLEGIWRWRKTRDCCNNGRASDDNIRIHAAAVFFF
jgi:hypothetical protein